MGADQRDAERPGSKRGDELGKKRMKNLVKHSQGWGVGLRAAEERGRPASLMHIVLVTCVKVA